MCISLYDCGRVYFKSACCGRQPKKYNMCVSSITVIAVLVTMYKRTCVLRIQPKLAKAWRHYIFEDFINP